MSRNSHWRKITLLQREIQNGHLGQVIWLTGLAAAGKTTIAVELEKQLFYQGKRVYLLDGDDIRHGLCTDLAFSKEDRQENIRRAAEVARLFADAGMIVITAFISPYRSDRQMARSRIGPGKFIEVFVNAPLKVCEQRDPKGLYAKARANLIQDFTGVSSSYENPENPEIELHTAQLTVGQCVSRILEHLSALNKE